LPCYLGIDTTSKCNLDCKMCFRSYVDVDYNTVPDLPADVLDRLIDELFPTAITLNLSTVGEPLMSPNMDKILDACAAYQVYLSITTNGTMMRGDDFIKKLASVLHHIEISVDSVQPERFKAFRSGASYQKVLHNAAKLGAIRRALPEPKFNLGFSMTLFRENLEEIPEVLAVVADVGGNFLKADIGVIFSKKELPQSVLNCPELYNEMYAIAQAKAQAAGLSLMMRPPFSDVQTKAVKYGLCDYLYVSAVVRSEGTLSPWYFGPALLGLNGGTFRAAWNNTVMQRLRSDHDTTRGHALCLSCYVFTDGGASVETRRKQFLKGDALT
jgi:MoaA/NifB/PqqE/SkfB family radical SAM enzyme